MFRIMSWNVNGVRAVMRKGFDEFLTTHHPDLLAIQETKATLEQARTAQLDDHGYHLDWNAAERKGYSGVATFTRGKPISTELGLGFDQFDSEGRVIISEFPEFTFMNIYFPNGKRDKQRLQFKLDFYESTLDLCKAMRKEGRRLIIGGDFNTAHTEIDLKNPKANQDTSGFLPEERAWIDRYIDAGFIDVFRQQHPDEPAHYTWWTYRFNARARNIGWRIDYFLVTDDLIDHVMDAGIHHDIMGSDHCPISLSLDF